MGINEMMGVMQNVPIVPTGIQNVIEYIGLRRNSLSQCWLLVRFETMSIEWQTGPSALSPHNLPATKERTRKLSDVTESDRAHQKQSYFSSPSTMVEKHSEHKTSSSTGVSRVIYSVVHRSHAMAIA